ncbi:MAG: hypothetical protein LH603_08385 [Pseudonocardia sp.]|nr:hypothetical protein [Pseudonocardia sp.]
MSTAGLISATRLDDMLAATRRLRTGFATTADRTWDATTAATELVVQLGHLAQCVRRADLGEQVPVDEHRPITDLGDELADVLLAALSIWTLSALPAEDPDLHRALRAAPAPTQSTRPAALLRLVADAGSLAEIAMVRTGHRHRPGGAVPPLPDAVAALIRGCLALAILGDHDLAGEFGRMVCDADRFLARAHRVTDRPGEFSTHERVGDRVSKHVDADRLTGRELPFPSGPAGADGLRHYLDTIRAAGVRLPPGLAVESGTPLTVGHTWVNGPTLIEATETDLGNVVVGVHEIAEWVRALDGADARIDTNLANFCLIDGSPVLIDVLPPLIPSRRPTARNLFEELFDSLCFDTSVTLDALVAYATTRLLHGGPTGSAAAGSLADLAHDLLGKAPQTGLAGTWFRARLLLATRCAAGQATLADLRALSAATSVLTFQRLDETRRREHLGAVQQQMRELGLATT